MNLTQLPFFLFFLLFTLATTQTQIGCLVWRNTFLKIENQTNSNANNVVIFTLYSRQYQGWVGFTMTSKEHNFENSISVVGYLPNNIIQLKNHTQITQKTIFSEGFFNRFSDAQDGIFSFTFKINVSEIQDKPFFYFANTGQPMPSTLLNSSNHLLKHYFFSSGRHFELNKTHFIPVCIQQLNISGRGFSENPISFVIVSFIYIGIGLLFLQYKDEQPFKSRFAGPFITLAALYFNLWFELFPTVVTVEDFSKLYCIHRMTTYSCIQLW
jgi:hypothetical protein